MLFSAFKIQGQGNNINHNLLTMMKFPGSYNGRREDRKFDPPDAAIEIQEARDVVLTNNHVAGSERWV